MDGPFETTFGIELEFVVLYKREDYVEACNLAYGHGHHHDEEDFEDVLVRHIVHVLRVYNFAVNNAHVDHTNNWTVTTDATVGVEQEELPSHLQGSHWYAIEIKSPAYRCTMEALTEVRRAVELIKKKFDIFVNESCGFHVHVGNHDRGFTLETVKNLALLLTVFERQINQLHPHHRNSDSWCQTPGYQFLGGNLWEVVEAIETMPDIANMVALMCSERDFPSGSKLRAYNFCNLTNAKIQTIEFRQHRGTMDVPAIQLWINLTCRLVSASHDAGPVGFIELVKEHANNPNFTVIDLLHNLGLEDLGRYYLMHYYSTRSTSRHKQKGLWIEPSTGEWLNLSNKDESNESTSDKSHGNDGTVGGQEDDNQLNQLYNRLNWGGEVTNDDVQIISETSWKDI